MKEKIPSFNLIYIDQQSQTSGYREMMDKPQSPMLMCCLTLKPIFHQNTNGFTLWARIGIDHQCERFMLQILTYWYLKSLRVSPVNFMLFVSVLFANAVYGIWALHCIR